jgi:hypothetical protein
MSFYEEQYNFRVSFDVSEFSTNDLIGIESNIDLSKIINTKPQNILITNVISNLYTVRSYAIQLEITNLFNDVMYYVDGSTLSPCIINRSYLSSKKINNSTKNKVIIKRISGGAYNGVDIKAVTNPTLFFSLILQYPFE